LIEVHRFSTTKTFSEHYPCLTV